MKFKIDKIFIIISAIFLSFMVGFYGSRMIYYYKNESKLIKNANTIIEYLKVNNNLTKYNNKYYFRLNAKNNYLLLDGITYRILYVDSKVYAISDSNVTKLRYGITSSYDSSDINKWLNDVFLNNVNNNYVKSVSLLDKETYSLIGKEKSYVTNGVFWLKDGLIVTKNGTLAQPSNYQDFLGVKPVIELNDFKYVSGDGTKKNPYIVNNRKRTSLSDLYSGEYIKYNGLLLRVIENNDNGTKVLSEKVKNVKYSTTNCEYETSDLGRFLNNNYIKKLNKNDLVLSKWYTYDYTSSYKDTYNEITNQYIGLLKIGDFFIDQVPNSFIMTEKDDKIYSIDKTRSLKVAELDSILDAYPSFVLKNTLSIKSGNGTKNNPYIVGE